MTAQELKTAATRLRDTAKNVDLGPPWATCDRAGAVVTGAEGRAGEWVAADLYEGDAAWIALAHPALAEPLADWLAFVATSHEPSPTNTCNWCFAGNWPCVEMKRALAVAKLINGSGP